MPWVIDPELQKRRQEVLDLLSCARAETSFMGAACEDLFRDTGLLIAGVPLGDKALSEVRASISHLQASTSNIDAAHQCAREINVMKWEPDDSEIQTSYRSTI